MKVLSLILKAAAIFYVLGTVAYMGGGDPNNPPPPGVWVLTAIIAGAFFFGASRVDKKIAEDELRRTQDSGRGLTNLEKDSN